jgi:hypothetical protein
MDWDKLLLPTNKALDKQVKKRRQRPKPRKVARATNDESVAVRLQKPFVAKAKPGKQLPSVSVPAGRKNVSNAVPAFVARFHAQEQVKKTQREQKIRQAAQLEEKQQARRRQLRRRKAAARRKSDATNTARTEETKRLLTESLGQGQEWEQEQPPSDPDPDPIEAMAWSEVNRSSAILVAQTVTETLLAKKIIHADQRVLLLASEQTCIGQLLYTQGFRFVAQAGTDAVALTEAEYAHCAQVAEIRERRSITEAAPLQMTFHPLEEPAAERAGIPALPFAKRSFDCVIELGCYPLQVAQATRRTLEEVIRPILDLLAIQGCYIFVIPTLEVARVVPLLMQMQTITTTSHHITIPDTNKKAFHIYILSCI